MTDMLDNGEPVKIKPFELFWKGITRKKEKGAAEAAYKRHVGGGDWTTDEEVAAAYNEQWERAVDVGKQQFFPAPGPWINKKKWLDLPEDGRTIKTFRTEIEKQQAATRAEQLKAHFEYDLGLATKKRDDFNAEMTRLRAKNQVDV